uniref:Uncharacterized protein n=1 Tax=Lepeophtheirus salmonis TaxID=72036 RepID=A0A0K2V0F7_LEPSM
MVPTRFEPQDDAIFAKLIQINALHFNEII